MMRHLSLQDTDKILVSVGTATIPRNVMYLVYGSIPCECASLYGGYPECPRGYDGKCEKVLYKLEDGFYYSCKFREPTLDELESLPIKERW